MKFINISKFVQHHRNILIFQRAPQAFGYYYIKVLFKLYYLFKQKERHLIKSNIKNFMSGIGWSDPVIINSVIKKAFYGIFMHYYEKMYSAYKPYKDVKNYFNRVITVKGQEQLDNALTKGKGVILVTAHWGGVEYVPWALALRNYPLSVILEYQSEKLREYLKEKNYYFKSVELINEHEVDSVWKCALGSLQQNRVVMTQCDEIDKWRKRAGRQIDLFNRKLYYDNAIELMAKYSGAEVVTAYMRRNSDKTYSLYLEHINAPSPNDIGRMIFKRLEYYMTANPDHWYQWKKWRNMLITEQEKEALPSKTPEDYRAVVFDLDNTLYYGNGIKGQVMTNTLQGGLISGSRVYPFQSARRELAGTQFDSEDELLSELALRAGKKKRMASLFPLFWDEPGFRKRKLENYKEWYQGTFYTAFEKALNHSCKAPPRVTQVLKGLQEGGVSLFCFSDYSRIAERLQAVGIDPGLFDGLYSGEELGELKPSARGILKAAAALRTELRTVLMVGDREDTDKGSADLAGCDFFRIHTGSKLQFMESWKALGIKFSLEINTEPEEVS